MKIVFDRYVKLWKNLQYNSADDNLHAEKEIDDSVHGVCSFFYFGCGGEFDCAIRFYFVRPPKQSTKPYICKV